MSTFLWGEIVKHHTIGDHTVIEYVVGPDYSDTGDTQYHHPESSCSFDTLDQALIHSICWKSEFGNYETATYVWRIIDGALK